MATVECSERPPGRKREQEGSNKKFSICTLKLLVCWRRVPSIMTAGNESADCELAEALHHSNALRTLVAVNLLAYILTAFVFWSWMRSAPMKKAYNLVGSDLIIVAFVGLFFHLITTFYTALLYAYKLVRRIRSETKDGR